MHIPVIRDRLLCKYIRMLCMSVYLVITWNGPVFILSRIKMGSGQVPFKGFHWICCGEDLT